MKIQKNFNIFAEKKLGDRATKKEWIKFEKKLWLDAAKVDILYISGV